MSDDKSLEDLEAELKALEKEEQEATERRNERLRIRKNREEEERLKRFEQKIQTARTVHQANLTAFRESKRNHDELKDTVIKMEALQNGGRIWNIVFFTSPISYGFIVYLLFGINDGNGLIEHLPVLFKIAGILIGIAYTPALLFYFYLVFFCDAFNDPPYPKGKRQISRNFSPSFNSELATHKAALRNEEQKLPSLQAAYKRTEKSLEALKKTLQVMKSSPT